MKPFIFSLIIISTGISLNGCNWFALEDNQSTSSSSPSTATEPEEQTNTEPEEQTNTEPAAVEPSPVEIPETISAGDIEVFAENLDIPWAMVWTSDERLVVTERPGQIRIIENGILKETPLHTFPGIQEGGEQGLLGMTKDPNYNQNQQLYLCYTININGQLRDRIVRFRDNGDALTEESIIFENIPAARYHAGCELDFGPDGKLYVTTGDATERNLAQNLDSWAGKILRLNADGSIPTDNPFPNSPIWSYGHRNPQGIDWDPRTGELYSAEHGPSAFDGPPGGDEVNLIRAGQNYGWPEVSHQESQEGMVDPLEVYTPAFAPGSLLIVEEGSEIFPVGSILVAGLRGADIRLLQVDQDNPDQIISSETLGLEVGRIRELSQGPDGSIYFATSNRDGRGTVRSGDDKIYRFNPQE